MVIYLVTALDVFELDVNFPSVDFALGHFVVYPVLVSKIDMESDVIILGHFCLEFSFLLIHIILFASINMIKTKSIL